TPPASRPPTQAAPPAQGRAASLAAAPPPPPPPSRTKDSGTKESGRKDTVPPASGYDPSDFDDHASTTKVADVKAHTGYDPSAFEDDESATKMAEIPDELLEAAKSLASPPSEEAGFRAVYAEFVAMKRRCGEPTDKLRFDRFKKTLTRNRDAILSKHDASTVRFTVYEKNGKAALRATPIK
ncbi:MAG: MXAN_5187 C-terminal domain-containing protein, partial [Myxococcota bacterium]